MLESICHQAITSTIKKKWTEWSALVLMSLLRQGRIPSHVAFIMDGNRRYARKNHLQTIKGHQKGFQALTDTLDWCLQLGIKVITVYAFSLDNFKRSKEEVDGLMDLIKTSFYQLLEECDMIEKKGVQIRVLGKIGLLPLDVQEAARKVMELTGMQNKAILNICVAYSSRQEITDAVQKVALERGLNGMSNKIITKEEIERELYTKECPPVDVLIRTSGETRLSDFLLWQCNEKTQLQFVDVLWPEYSFWDIVKMLLTFQLFSYSFRPTSSISNSNV